MNKYFKWKVLLIILATAASIWKVYPSHTWSHFPKTDQINLGLDLQGGMHLLLRVDLNAVPEAARKDATDRAVEVIRNRIDEFGVREPSISKQGKDQIIIQLPGITDQKRAKDIIGKTALLEFRMAASDPELIKKAEEPDAAVPEGYEWLELKDERRTEKLLVEKEAKLTGQHLVNAGVQFDQGSFGQPVVSLEFDGEGGKTFADITAKAAADFRRDGNFRRLAIVLDGELRTAPQVKEAIYGGKAVIEGTFSFEEATDIALMLRAGALPAPVILEEERTVGPTLGRDSIEQSVRAAIVGMALVFLFAGIYYLVPGMIAVTGLLLNVILIMGALSIFQASLTLPGIAGIILTVGMAVDANVLIYERIREEVKVGKALRSAISAGYHNAISAIMDSNLTTLFTALILFWFGSGPIRGFAVTLSMGIVTSVFTAVVVTQVIFDFITRGGRQISLKMLQFFGETKFDFLKFRRMAYVFSLALVMVGVGWFIKRGETNYGIDFTGGAIHQVRFPGPVALADLRSGLEKEGLKSIQIQNFGEEDKHEILIRSASEDADKIEGALKNVAGEGKFEILRVETVGPAVGTELRSMAVKSIILGLGVILTYVAFRFSFVYSVAGILALLHDVLVAAGIFSLSGREFSLPMVAALLTIAGYSINDTIVIFDRIRENVKLMRRTPFPDIVNISVNQTLSRSVLTSGATLLVVIALFLFGGPVINDFAFTLLVGFIAGSYSTIFVASPMVVDWMGRKALARRA
ncbi:MAG: protein translocase subunit SecD [Candidatus Omnitrophica bacterium]|nr:protein translocase subunit SecD [Candidatus Omnitrophota bacterium]